jgi:hypothetical protein
VNTTALTSAPHEADSAVFSVVNTIALTSAPHEADSAVFSVVNTIALTSAPHEADSVVFSVLNSAATTTQAHEADSVVFSVNNTPGTGAIQSSLLQQPISPSEGETLPDGDGDGLSDGEEVALGTSPGNPDTDGDGYPDGLEVALGSNPLDISSVPDVGYPGIFIGPVLDIQNQAIVYPQVGNSVQAEQGEKYVVQILPATKRNGNVFARLRTLFP